MKFQRKLGKLNNSSSKDDTAVPSSKDDSGEPKVFYIVLSRIYLLSGVTPKHTHEEKHRLRD